MLNHVATWIKIKVDVSSCYANEDSKLSAVKVAIVIKSKKPVN